MINRFQDLTHDALALALRHILKLTNWSCTMRMAHGLPVYPVVILSFCMSAFCDQKIVVCFLPQDETHADTESELTAVSV